MALLYIAALLINANYSPLVTASTVSNLIGVFKMYVVTYYVRLYLAVKKTRQISVNKPNSLITFSAKKLIQYALVYFRHTRFSHPPPFSRLVLTIDACFQKWAVASEHTRMGFLGKGKVKTRQGFPPLFPQVTFIRGGLCFVDTRSGVPSVRKTRYCVEVMAGLI